MAGKLSKAMGNLKIEEPKFEKWNELPPELKLECIKTLDFNTKWSLRSTSHTERALVDTQKMNIEIIRINYTRLNLQFPSSDRTVINTHYQAETMMIVLEYIFKHSTIDILQILNANLEYEKMDVLQNVSVKRLEFDNVADLEMSFWLRCLNEKIERIEIDSASAFGGLLIIPSVRHVHFLQIANIKILECAPQLAQIWMEKDAEVGRTFQTIVMQKGAFAQFPKHFPNKIVSETPEHIRIQTGNSAKHILLELGSSYHWYLKGSEEFLRMSVISAELKELDTDKSWVQDLERTLPEEDYDRSWEYDYDNVSSEEEV